MEFIFKETLNSTNTYAKEHMDELNDLSFIYCNSQTAGKGRLERKWVSENPDNIYLTIVLKPENPDYPYINLTQYLCVIVCKVLEKYGVEPNIKWPNDILVGGKKIAGILAQTATTGNRIKGIALGIGININSAQEEVDNIDKPATSLNLEINRKVNREAFLQELAQEFEKNYPSFCRQGFSYIENDYLKHACFIDKDIVVSVNDEIIAGRATGVDREGALILCYDNNNKEIVINMGEIQ